MILNSKSNQFVFNLPADFLFDSVKEKYDPYIKKLYTPFSNTLDYLNHTIQSVTLPSISIDVIEQNVGPIVYSDDINDPNAVKLMKNTMRWQDADDLKNIINDMTITFKLTDSYLNYWIIFENLLTYNNITNQKDYFSDFIINFLNREGYIVLNVKFKMPFPINLTTVDLNYSQVAIDFKTFSMEFIYSNIDIHLFEKANIK